MTEQELMEHYAGLALQAILSNHGVYDESRGCCCDTYTADEAAETAYTYASALVLQVRKQIDDA